ncbi:MAG: quinoprotein dehydrogenase-associated putative ABC transporter substrate-binding protein [Methyloceanibacter sp.]
MSSIISRILTASVICLAASSFAALPAAAAKKNFHRDLSKNFDELTPSEQIAIRAAAKAAYKAKKLRSFNVCADPGNMPLSNIEGEGFQQKMAKVLGEAMGARVTYSWRPFLERGLTRQTFDQDMCDVMFDMPANYGPLLTTFPVYKTPYVLVYRNDKGLELTGLDDPKLKDLKIGVFQTSGIRAALAKRGIVNNVKLQVQSHDADLVPEHQPWYISQKVLNGDLDVAAVFGPFAGWLKTMKDEPLTILPVNLDDDTVPLEFDLAIGVRKTDAFLKYMLEFALEDKADEIAKILEDYGVPLVQCSKCVAPGDLPAHGSYIALADQEFKARPDLASPDQVVTQEKVEGWLADGADITQELSNAVIGNDTGRVKFLVGKGADVNKVDNQGATPLTSAARQRHEDMVELLIELGADVNLTNKDGTTPLVAAVLRDHVPTIEVLLKHGADAEKPGPDGYRPLALSIGESKYEVAKTLMEAGADVKSPTGAEDLTPLMIAAAQKAPAEGAIFLPSSTRPIDIAKGLLERGADVNSKSKTGMTALMIAAAHNNPPMIGLLIESGADINATNSAGKTAAGVAELNDNMEAAQAVRVLGTAKAASSAPAPSDKGTTSQ